jgi:hypothetical protein
LGRANKKNKTPQKANGDVWLGKKGVDDDDDDDDDDDQDSYDDDDDMSCHDMTPWVVEILDIYAASGRFCRLLETSDLIFGQRVLSGWIYHNRWTGIGV